MFRYILVLSFRFVLGLFLFASCFLRYKDIIDILWIVTVVVIVIIDSYWYNTELVSLSLLILLLVAFPLILFVVIKESFNTLSLLLCFLIINGLLDLVLSCAFDTFVVWIFIFSSSFICCLFAAYSISYISAASVIECACTVLCISFSSFSDTSSFALSPTLELKNFRRRSVWASFFVGESEVSAFIKLNFLRYLFFLLLLILFSEHGDFPEYFAFLLFPFPST